ncbi:MAG: hypothetical protein H0V30_15545 [Chitinophagaceae bacterium]|jgi:hypothetical protein|nr:hypothetical protein [Chitinophagaceae bacterium]
MKRILFVSMVSLAFMACNNDETDTTTVTDSITIYENNTGVGTTDTGMMVDTSMMRDTMNRDPL